MTLGSILSYFSFQLLVPLLFTVSIAAFLWGMCLHLFAGGHDEELAENGKAVMLYSFLSLVITIVIYVIFATIRAQVG